MAAANPEKKQAQQRRHLYGLDEATFTTLLKAQDHRCTICLVSTPECVDHCHRDGRVRGLLCRPCNAALGQFRDDPDLLRAALRYLEGGQLDRR